MIEDLISAPERIKNYKTRLQTIESGKWSTIEETLALPVNTVVKAHGPATSCFVSPSGRTVAYWHQTIHYNTPAGLLEIIAKDAVALSADRKFRKNTLTRNKKLVDSRSSDFLEIGTTSSLKVVLDSSQRITRAPLCVEQKLARGEYNSEAYKPTPRWGVGGNKEKWFDLKEYCVPLGSDLVLIGTVQVDAMDNKFLDCSSTRGPGLVGINTAEELDKISGFSGNLAKFLPG